MVVSTESNHHVVRLEMKDGDDDLELPISSVVVTTTVEVVERLGSFSVRSVGLSRFVLLLYIFVRSHEGNISSII